MTSTVLLVADGMNVGVYEDESIKGGVYRWPMEAVKEARKLREKGKRERIVLYRVRVHDQEEF